MQVLKLGAFFSVPLLGGAFLIARSGRKACEENIQRIEEIARRYQDQTDGWAKESKTAAQLNYAKKWQSDDEDWVREEIGKQLEWLNRPWYRQLSIPPFPNYIGR
jgi:hypothetical protein